METQTYTLELNLLFPTSPERIFAAWTKENLLKKWCGPENYQVTHFTSTFTEGAPWHSQLISPKNSIHRPFGVYHILKASEKLIFTHQWRQDDGKKSPETQVEITLQTHVHSPAEANKTLETSQTIEAIEAIEIEAIKIMGDIAEGRKGYLGCLMRFRQSGFLDKQEKINHEKGWTSAFTRLTQCL